MVPQLSAAVEVASVKDVTRKMPQVPGVAYHSHKILLKRARIAAITASLAGDEITQRLRELADPPLQLVLLVRQLAANIDELRKLVSKLTVRAAQHVGVTAAENALCSELQTIGDAARALVDRIEETKSQRYGNSASVAKELQIAIATQRVRAEAQAERLMALLEYVIDSCVIPTKTTVANAELAKRIKLDHKRRSGGPMHHLGMAAVAAVTELDSGTAGVAALESFDQQPKISKELQPSSFSDVLTQSSDVDREMFTRKTKNLLQTLLNESVRETCQTATAVENGNGKDKNDGHRSSGKSFRFIKIKSGNDPAVKLLVSYNIILQAPKNPYLIRLRPFGLLDSA